MVMKRRDKKLLKFYARAWGVYNSCLGMITEIAMAAKSNGFSIYALKAGGMAAATRQIEMWCS